MTRSFSAAVALLALLLSAFPVAGATRARYLMGTICEISAPDVNQITSALDEAARVENLLSTWRGDTALARLNAAGSSDAPPELAKLLAFTLDWRDRTANAFNPLIAPLVDVWRIREGGRVPSAPLLESALARTAASNVSIEGTAIRLTNGAAFEEGAFGKGYALDRMLTKIPGGDAVLNFGGQLLVRGSVPVTVAAPDSREHPVLAFTLTDASLSTSSGSEKTFEAGGRRFCHIIDPRSGMALPPRGSASAIAADATTADILSTALYVMGSDDGLRWADEHGVAALFITSDHEIRRSRAFRLQAKSFEILDDHYKTKD